jgi:diguanylate cyclase (GGDEF)-like protein/PAS domain S-box-containing protein
MAVSANSAREFEHPAGTPVEMLVIGCTTQMADHFANALRNQGQAAHVKVAGDLEGLKQQLDSGGSDLVVVNADNLQDETRRAIERVRKSSPTASILLVAAEPRKLTAFAVEHELQDVVAIDNEQQLALAIRREHHTQSLRYQCSRLQSKLDEAEERSNLLVRSSRDAIAYVHDGMYLDTNQTYLDIFGYEAFEEIDGLPIMDMVEAESRGAFKLALRQLKELGKYAEEFTCVTNDGQTFSARMEFSPASIDGEQCTQVMIRDQSHSLALQQRIDELTNKDAHTGFLNRQAFMERLEALLEVGGDERPAYSLVQLSISNYMALREACGFECTDGMLRELANVLIASAVNADTIARFGEHDFMLLCGPDEPALEVAERCLHNLRGHAFRSIGDSMLAPSYSIGVTRADAAMEISAHELINRSCRATAIAESEGENRVVFHNDQIPGETGGMTEADAAIVDLIDTALANDGFRLKYQPIVSLQGDTRENYSVYLRLIDGDQELTPDMFLAPAQTANRLAEIDRWVVRNAIRELARHRRDGKKIIFVLNLSLASIEDDSILLWICDCLREFRAKGSWLTFQFRENDLRAALEPATALIAGLRRINCRIAVSGHTESGDTVLQKLDADIVKLSPEFTRDLGKDREQQDRLGRINASLQEAGYKTVASSIEDASSLAILWNISVNYIQGYFLQEPTSTIVFDDE